MVNSLILDFNSHYAYSFLTIFEFESKSLCYSFPFTFDFSNKKAFLISFNSRSMFLHIKEFPSIFEGSIDNENFGDRENCLQEQMLKESVNLAKISYQRS